MAFIVSLKEGEGVSVAGTLLTLVSIQNHGSGLVEVCGKNVRVSWGLPFEVLPGVTVSVDRKSGQADRLKLLFEADRSIPIQRVSPDETDRHICVPDGDTPSEAMRPLDGH